MRWPAIATVPRSPGSGVPGSGRGPCAGRRCPSPRRTPSSSADRAGSGSGPSGSPSSLRRSSARAANASRRLGVAGARSARWSTAASGARSIAARRSSSLPCWMRRRSPTRGSCQSSVDDRVGEQQRADHDQHASRACAARASSPQRGLRAAERAGARVAGRAARHERLGLGVGRHPARARAARPAAPRRQPSHSETTSAAASETWPSAVTSVDQPGQRRAGRGRARARSGAAPSSGQRHAARATGTPPHGPRRRDPGDAANSHRWAAGSSSAAAYGFTSHTTAASDVDDQPRRGGQPAGRRAPARREPRARAAAARRTSRPRATSAVEAIATSRRSSNGYASGITGAAGTVERAGQRRAARSHSHASSGAHRAGGDPPRPAPDRQLAAARAEQAVERGEQRGQQQRPDQQPHRPVGQHVAHRDDPVGPARERRASAAARSVVGRPGLVDRRHRAQHRRARTRPAARGVTRLVGAGPRSPVVPIAHRREARARRPRPARRPSAGARAADPLPGGAGAAGVGRRPRRAARPRPCAAARAAARSRRRDHGTTHGLRIALAGQVAEHEHGVDRRRRPPLAPTRARPRSRVPPEVETSTSVLRRSRWRNMRASSSSAAVRRQLGAARARRARRGARARRSAGSTGPGGRRPRSPGRVAVDTPCVERVTWNARRRVRRSCVPERRRDAVGQPRVARRSRGAGRGTRGRAR